jgi:glycosyltransferase involved in cell wall biosynthesis
MAKGNQSKWLALAVSDRLRAALTLRPRDGIVMIKNGFDLLSNSYWAQFPESKLVGIGFPVHWVIFGAWRGGRLFPKISLSQSGASVTATISIRPPASQTDSIPKFVVREVLAQLEIEPALAAPGNKVINRLPVVKSHDFFRRLGINWLGMRQLLQGSFENVLLVPHIVRGGADSYANSIIQNLEGKTLVVTTLPQAKATAKILEAYKGFKSAKIVSIRQIVGRPTDEVVVMARLLNAMQPRNIVVINSELGYSVLARFGIALSYQSRCVAAFFSVNPTVVARQFAHAWIHKLPPEVNVVTDNLPAIRFLSPIHSGKLHYIPGMVNVGSARWRPSESPRKRWLWLGRLDEFKGLDLLGEIAKIRPQDVFHVYGPKPRLSLATLGLGQKNVVMKGELNSYEDLPVSSYDGLVFTSRFEGFPLVVIEGLACSLPIVSTDVGGIKDELGDLVKLIEWEKDMSSVAKNFSRQMTILQQRTLDVQQQAVEAMRDRFASRFSDSAFKKKLKELLQ